MLHEQKQHQNRQDRRYKRQPINLVPKRDSHASSLHAFESWGRNKLRPEFKGHLTFALRRSTGCEETVESKTSSNQLTAVWEKNKAPSQLRKYYAISGGMNYAEHIVCTRSSS
jgi:hypothetical protein